MRELPERAISLHIRTVILWLNGLVMVFDDRGQQIPEYQGVFEAVETRINAVFSGRWEYGDWNQGLICDTPFSSAYLDAYQRSMRSHNAEKRL